MLISFHTQIYIHFTQFIKIHKSPLIMYTLRTFFYKTAIFYKFVHFDLGQEEEYGGFISNIQVAVFLQCSDILYIDQFFETHQIYINGKGK